jgi:Lon protease-like protein
MPGAPLPLHIFEPRYRQLTVDLVTGAVPDKQFGVVAMREGWEADDEPGGLHRIGCTAELLDARRLPDGRFRGPAVPDG